MTDPIPHTETIERSQIYRFVVLCIDVTGRYAIQAGICRWEFDVRDEDTAMEVLEALRVLRRHGLIDGHRVTGRFAPINGTVTGTPHWAGEEDGE